MNEHHETDPRQAGHEWVDINVRGLLIAIAGLAASIILSFGVTWWLLTELTANRPPSRSEFESFGPTTVKTPLDPNQRAVRLRSEKQQQSQLSQYEWLDSKHEFARIPIGRAMELTVERHQSPEKEKQP